MIRLEGVHFRYEQDMAWVFRDLHWHMLPGQWVAVVGSNGAGKTTLASLLKGILQPQRGRIRVLADDVRGPLPPQRAVLLSADPDAQILGATVEEDLAFSLECLDEDPQQILALVQKALHLFGLESLRDHPPHLLSGGEQQRVVVAAAWVVHPALWILDEALSMMESKWQRAVLTAIMSRKDRRGAAGILTTHDMGLARLLHGIWRLQGGRLIRAT